MEFRILGPLEVVSDDELVEVHGAKARALLALFLVHANQVVAPDRLIDDLWDGAPPNTATPTLQTYVSQVRKSLPRGSLVTRPSGYVLEVAPGDVDARRFEDAFAGVSRCEDASADWVAARLGEALGWWRGPALADFEGAAWAQPEAARLEGLRLAAIERLTGARLALGEHAALVPELEALVEQHPWREGLWAQLMLALYRSDRQADALRAYGRLRRHLGEELGIEPSKELVGLEEAILLQKPELDWPAPRLESTAGVSLPVPVVLRDAADELFVGRGPELDALKRAWKDASAGERRGGAHRRRARCGKDAPRRRARERRCRRGRVCCTAGVTKTSESRTNRGSRRSATWSCTNPQSFSPSTWRDTAASWPGSSPSSRNASVTN